MTPDRRRARSSTRTDLLVDQQDVTPLGLAFQAIELQATEDPARRRAPARAPRDEGLGSRPMATIVYLDVDDEITSAAARIRAPDERRVALVLPYGSRLVDVADQLPAPGPRGDAARPPAGHRRAGCVHPGARRVRGPAGVPLGGRVRGVARRRPTSRRAWRAGRAAAAAAGGTRALATAAAAGSRRGGRRASREAADVGRHARTTTTAPPR